jgi:hypothetical protein
MGRLVSIGQDQAYGRGVRDLLDFAEVFSASASGAEKNALGRFFASAQRRFSKFA